MSEELHATQPRGETNDPRSATTIITGVISLALIFATVVALEALYYSTVEGEDFRKVGSQPPAAVEQLHREQQQQLSEYRWVDPEKGVVALPIERAMQLVVQEAAKAGE